QSTLTSCLPTLPPCNIAINASGALSIPCAMVSLERNSPARHHLVRACRASGNRSMKSLTRNPSTRSRLLSTTPNQGDRDVGIRRSYDAIWPHTTTRAFVFKTERTTSLTLPPTLSKYTSTPNGLCTASCDRQPAPL